MFVTWPKIEAADREVIGESIKERLFGRCAAAEAMEADDVMIEVHLATDETVPQSGSTDQR